MSHLLLKRCVAGVSLLMLLGIASAWVSPRVASAHSRTSAQALRVTTSCPPTLQQGSSGTWVTALQFRLNIVATDNLGISTHLTIDGSFGGETKALVQQVEIAYGGIDTNGVVGPQTWSALGLCNQGFPPFTQVPASNIYPCPPTLRLGSNGIWVNVLQNELNTSSIWGNFPLDPLLAQDGDFGSHTFNAVEAFQGTFGLQFDGVVGPHTWAVLGMC